MCCLASFAVSESPGGFGAGFGARMGPGQFLEACLGCDACTDAVEEEADGFHLKAPMARSLSSENSPAEALGSAEVQPVVWMVPLVLW